MRIDEKQGLKAGQHIEVMDSDDVPHGVVVHVEKLYPEELTGGASIAAYRLMRDTFMASIVTGWTYGDLPNDGEPVPTGDPKMLQKLPSGAYRALRKATEQHYIDAGFIKGPAKEEEGKPQVPGK